MPEPKVAAPACEFLTRVREKGTCGKPATRRLHMPVRGTPVAYTSIVVCDWHASRMHPWPGDRWEDIR